MRRSTTLAAVTLAMLLTGALAGDDSKSGKKDETAKQEDDDLPTQDLRAGGDEMKRYFVHGPKKDAKQPKDGWRLVYVLPGGDGSAEFQGFAKNIRRRAWTDDYIGVQLVAPKWDAKQGIVWPTAGSPYKGAKFTTEEFFAAVHAEVSKKYRVDARYVFALGWSSGGPPVYTLALQDKSPVTGAYLAMSVFQPDRLPKLTGAKGRPFFIDHSPEDDRCPFSQAEEARDALTKAGAKVEFVTYKGGHGWEGDLWGRQLKGRQFLEKHAKQ